MPAGDCRPVKPDEEKESSYGSKLRTRILKQKLMICVFQRCGLRLTLLVRVVIWYNHYENQIGILL